MDNTIQLRYCTIQYDDLSYNIPIQCDPRLRISVEST